MRIFFTRIVACYFLFLGALTLHSQTILKEVKGFSYPESITSDLKYYYVSNLGKELNPMATDSDGFITRMSKNGDIIEQSFLPEIKLNSPKGLAVLDNNLWIADVNRILVVSLKTRIVVWKKEFPETRYLNDIVVKDEATVYVSATDINVIYEIDFLTDTVRVYDTESLIDGPNGMAIDNLSDNLYVAGYGSNGKPGYICRFNLRTGEVQKISPPGYYDGIYFTFGKYIYTDWGTEPDGSKGKLLMYDVRYDKIVQLLEDRNFRGPADFHYVPGRKQVLLPCMLEHTVYIIKL